MEPGGLFGHEQSIIKQPKDKLIFLKDVLEADVDSKYYLSEKAVSRINRSINGDKCFAIESKSLCLTAGYYKQDRDNQYIVHNTMPRSSKTKKGGSGPLSRKDGKTYCLDTGSTNAVEIVAMRGRKAVLTPKRTEYGKAIRKDYEAGEIKTQRKYICFKSYKVMLLLSYYK